MKTIILSIFTVIISLFSLQANAQDRLSKNNYVVLTSKIPQLKPILLTADALEQEDGNNYGDFQIIICGKTVEDLKNKDLMHDFIHKAEAQKVKIVVCGFSLKKFKIDENEIPEELEVVPNGILYDFQLQKKGYRSLAL
ncbi:DsrE/DsrF/DsrH-like protein [Gillisia mitskevichiae]|uniref:DsrE/DsrF/DsrH-like protein n=1 Tax=Gillisia mitskevichiae TaxID=270921 RepID=A0A495PT61_9FLAO|nr:DsrE family protein [Gillisia mitskevichiae]RKS53377.1 DsrE/DsrF/DsrH-like protein [Gillisia mitskevichiae]